MLLLHIAKNIHTQNEQEKVTIDLHIKDFSSLNWRIWTKKNTPRHPFLSFISKTIPISHMNQIMPINMVIAFLMSSLKISCAILLLILLYKHSLAIKTEPKKFLPPTKALNIKFPTTLLISFANSLACNLQELKWWMRYLMTQVRYSMASQTGMSQ